MLPSTLLDWLFGKSVDKAPNKWGIEIQLKQDYVFSQNIVQSSIMVKSFTQIIVLPADNMNCIEEQYTKTFSVRRSKGDDFGFLFVHFLYIMSVFMFSN